jgi:hypothetical protein
MDYPVDARRGMGALRIWRRSLGHGDAPPPMSRSPAWARLGAEPPVLAGPCARLIQRHPRGHELEA